MENCRSTETIYEMFGDCVPFNVIEEIGNKHSWDVTKTVDHLIKYIEENNDDKKENAGQVEFKISENQENDRNVDVLIESENMSVSELSDAAQGKRTGAIKKQIQSSGKFADLLKGGSNTFQDAAPKKQPPKMNMLHNLLQEVCRDINSGIKVMILIRGLPGSGKTFLARRIVDETVKGDYRRHIFSADDFFTDVNGIYNYDRDKLSAAHSFTQNSVYKRAYDGWSPIIVDNTHMELWEMLPYCKYAVQFGYMVHVLEPATPWAWHLARLVQKNTHNVSREALERKLLKYERLSKDILTTFQLKYTVNMPQLRHNPPFEGFQIPPPGFNSFSPISERPELPETPTEVKIVPFKFPSESNSDTPKSSTPQMSLGKSSESDESPTTSPAEMEVDWMPHEEEANRFWNTNPIQQPGLNAKVTNEVKEQRTPKKNMPENALLEMLKESIVPKKDNESAEKTPSMAKHRKGCKNENQSFAQLRQIYPNIPVEYLWDIFVDCKGDIEWTVDIILQDETNMQKVQQGVEVVTTDFPCICDGVEYKETPWDTPQEIKMKQEKQETTPQRQRNQRVKVNVINESLAAAKRRIEESVTIKDEHYSDHVRKIRDIKRGNFLVTSTEVSGAIEGPELGAYASPREQSPSSDSDPEEELVEVELGDTLIEQMEKIFSIDGSAYDRPGNLKTNIFMPKLMLQQIHALWVESLFNQLEQERLKNLKEDENYARILQMKDFGCPDTFFQEAPSVTEMNDMEFTWEAYKCATVPQDLAAQLTRTKLYETFPEAEKSFLDDILASNNHKFAPTVELLSQSVGRVQNNGRKIMEEIKQENQEIDQKIQKLSSTGAGKGEQECDKERKAALQDFEENRNKANSHTELKVECYQKAQEAVRKNMKGVAGYYNQVAELHKKKIDEYNHRAANSLVEAHSLKQKNSEMLDLHYLHVNEAIVCLDLFLDHHINQLRTVKKPYKFVFMITGRGLHSAGGVPTIKHNVKNRLHRRKLKFVELNPGLLRTKVFYTSKMSEESRH
ncbi:uncharacterized protein DMENIID0001_077480 [Sergentomyia squamirostris]